MPSGNPNDYARPTDDLVIEGGYFTRVTIDGGFVTKVDLDELSQPEAEQRLAAVGNYVAALLRQNVPVAELNDADLIPGDNPGTLRVRHVQRQVDGVSLAQVESGSTTPRQALVRDVIRLVCNMTSIDGDIDKLEVGIDAHARNWRIASTTGLPTLVDVFPPLLRGQNGSFNIGGDSQCEYIDRMMGTKSGAIAQLLMTAYPTLETFGRYAVYKLLPFTEEWQQLIPADLYGKVMDAMKIYATMRRLRHIGLEALRAAGIARESGSEAPENPWTIS